MMKRYEVMQGRLCPKTVESKEGKWIKHEDYRQEREKMKEDLSKVLEQVFINGFNFGSAVNADVQNLLPNCKKSISWAFSKLIKE